MKINKTKFPENEAILLELILNSKCTEIFEHSGHAVQVYSGTKEGGFFDYITLVWCDPEMHVIYAEKLHTECVDLIAEAKAKLP